MAKKKQVKFTKKEIESLENLRNAYAFIQNSLGNLEIQRLQTEQTLERIHNQKIRLETQYVQEQANESNLFEQLTKKYGPGDLDITTGKFNIYCKLRARDTKHAKDLIFTIDDIPGISRSETMISLEESINDKKRLMHKIFNEIK